VMPSEGLAPPQIGPSGPATMPPGREACGRPRISLHRAVGYGAPLMARPPRPAPRPRHDVVDRAPELGQALVRLTLVAGLGRVAAPPGGDQAPGGGREPRLDCCMALAGSARRDRGRVRRPRQPVVSGGPTGGSGTRGPPPGNLALRDPDSVGPRRRCRQDAGSPAG
jgi:hypothetical protein